MSKNKRKSDLENADEKKVDSPKTNRGKGLKTGFATLVVCAAAFGAYYSPHFRTASSDWLERGRAFVAKRFPNGFGAKKNDATADEKMREKLAQAPSFRDFLTEEYGEDGARELLGIDETAAETSVVANAGGGFADYVVAESDALEPSNSQEVADDFPGPGASFADYVAAENDATQEAANDGDAASEADSNLADYVASKPVDDFESNEAEVNEEKTRLAFDDESVSATVAEEDETALAARLQAEMKERGVGNPRIERWGGRFWRASGFATTSEGVATFCEAVDVDPTSAQRAALAKFDAANF